MEQPGDQGTLPVRPDRPKSGLLGFLRRAAVGAAITLVVLVVLYGFNSAIQLLALAVLCTAGIALIPLMFVGYLVGWVATTAWNQITVSRSLRSPSDG